MDVESVVVKDQNAPSRTLLAGAVVSLVLGGGGLWTVITNPLLSSSKTMYLYHLPLAARIIMGIISVPLLLFALLALLVSGTLKRNKLTLSLSGISASGNVRAFRLTWHEIGSVLLVYRANKETLLRMQFALTDSEQDLSFLAHQELDGQQWYEIPLDLTPKTAEEVEKAIERFRPRLIVNPIRSHASRVNPNSRPG